CSRVFSGPIIGPPLTSTLFPYTTLFRSDHADGGRAHVRGCGLLVEVMHIPNPGKSRSGTYTDYLLSALTGGVAAAGFAQVSNRLDRKSTRLNSSHVKISYAVFCLKKKKR